MSTHEIQSLLITSNQNATQTSGGDLVFTFREPLARQARLARGSGKVLGRARVALANAMFPVSFTGVHAGTNALRATGLLGGLDATIELDSRAHYEPNGLASTIEALLRDKGFDIMLRFDETSLRIYAQTSEDAYTLRADGTTAHEALGLERGVDLELPAGTATAFPRPVDLAGPRYLVVSTDLPSHNNSDAGANIGGTLASVPVTASPGQMLAYHPPSLLWSSTHIEQLSQLRVRITDEHGRIVDFAGIPWSMLLLFEFSDT